MKEIDNYIDIQLIIDDLRRAISFNERINGGSQ